MDKLTKQQLSGISKLVHLIHDENVLQCILETIGKENWTRDILGNCHLSLLTEEQENILESLGGLYTGEEMDEYIENSCINHLIAEKLKEQGITHHLYENKEYLDEIREGKIICEGIDVEKIKTLLNECEI